MKATKGRAHGHRWCRLDDPIFRARHWVFFGPRRTGIQAMESVLGMPVDSIPEGVGGCAVNSDMGNSMETVTYIASDIGAGEHLDTLIHEANHATFFALHRAKVKLTHKTTEVFAYYHEWLVREGRRGVGL